MLKNEEKVKGDAGKPKPGADRANVEEMLKAKRANPKFKANPKRDEL
jgi:hypothetical protein